MSRSIKKAIIKDKGCKKVYWSQIRSSIKNHIKNHFINNDLETLEIPNPKTIVDDYSYCDYTIDYEHCNFVSAWSDHDDLLSDRKKYSRK